MLHLLKETKANVEGVLREISFSLSKCFSKLNGNLAAFFFDNEKRMNVFKKLQDVWTRYSPNILFFPVRIGFSAWGIALIAVAAKIFINPIYKTFIGRGNIHSKIELSSFRRINFALPKHDTSLAINNSRKVSQFFPMIHGIYNV